MELKLEIIILIFIQREIHHNLPWKSLKVDIVLECSGVFTSKEKALVI